MQNNTVQDLIDYVKDLTGQTNLKTAVAIRALNFTADEYARIQMTHHGDRDYSAYNNISRETATISGTKDSLDTDVIAIEQVDVLIDGKYRKLDPIDSKRYDQPLDTVYNTPGKPQYYEYKDHHLYWYPQLDGEYTARLDFKRAHPRFSADNLTQSTSVVPIDDEFLAIGASVRVMVGKNDPSVARLEDKYERMKMDIKETINKFDQNKPRKMPVSIPSAFMKRNR